MIDFYVFQLRVLGAVANCKNTSFLPRVSILFDTNSTNNVEKHHFKNIKTAQLKKIQIKIKTQNIDLQPRGGLRCHRY